MKEILTYFRGKRAESVLFIGTGIISILFGFSFELSAKKSFHYGMASSLAMIGLIQLIAGSVIYFRARVDLKRIENYLSGDRSKIKSEELPRMERVMHTFVSYRYAEIILAILGIALIFFFAWRSFWSGFGVGLFAQAMLILIFDYFAESRGRIFIDFLRRLE